MREKLGLADFYSLRAEGEAMSNDEAVEFVLEGIPQDCEQTA